MMTEQIIVAVYDHAADAAATVRDLEAANVATDAIRHYTGNADTATTTAAPPREQGYWASLFGSEPDHDTSVYDRSLDSGSSVVTVRASKEHFDQVSTILEKHNPIDVDERARQYASVETTTPGSAAKPKRETVTAATDDGSIQLAEETLAVAKRAVSGGTTRIRRYVVETPVQEQVTLHGETVTLERRPVTDNRPVSDADFTDKVIEMTETSEEAVVSKTARVIEEVSLRKDASDHVEMVKDTVRRDEVEIEKVPGATAQSDQRRKPLR